MVAALARGWAGKRVSDISSASCRLYATDRKPTAARSELEKLAAALNHWHREYGPLRAIPAITMPPKPAPRERWLTRQEAARLLWAARRTPHLARFILIGLYTGSRAGAIRELQWSWIDLSSGIMRRRAPGSPEASNKRKPPVRLGPRILAHLRRWKRLDGAAGRYIVNWQGQPIKDAFRTSWPRAIAKAGLSGVSPHTLRHTRATWLMQAGIDIWEAAGSLGMSTRTLEAVYGHQHPDWQRAASRV